MLFRSGGSADCFRFDTTPNSSTNRDSLTDFSPSQGDRIELALAAFPNLAAATGPLASSAFVVGTSFSSIDQRLLYNTSTGELIFDSNGSDPAAGTLATVALLPTGLGAQMSASLFTVI